MIFLGIDPGTKRMGYGAVAAERGGPRLLDAGVISVAGKQEAAILCDIRAGLSGLLDKFRPDAVGVEKLYFAKNQTTGIAVAQARGVALLAAEERGLPIYELSPTEVKLQLTGDGRADKKAVLKMVRLILKEPRLNVLDDASDAIAIALVTAQNHRFRQNP